MAIMKRHLMLNKDAPLFTKLLISNTLSILVSLLLTSAVLYFNFENIAIKQVYANDMDTLMQTAKGVDALTNMAVTLSSQIYNDLSVARIMYYADPGTDDIRTADAQLTNYRLSLPFIDSIYVYNGKRRTFYVNSIVARNEMRQAIQNRADFDDEYVVKLIDGLRRRKPYEPIPRIYRLKGIEGTVKNYYTFLMHDAFSAEEIDNAVIVNFSQDWIADYMSDNSPEKKSKTFILDASGSVVSEAGFYPMMSDASKLRYIRQILGKEGPGYLVESIDGKKSLVSYTSPDKNGWRYVKLSPREFIMRKIDRMKYVTVLLGFFLIVVGLVASWFLTRRIYQPIDSLITAMRRLSLEEKKNVKLLRQVFFRDLFLGRGIYDGQTIEIKLEELGTEFNAAGYYCVILIKIDRHLAFSQEYSAVDQGLAKNAIMESCAAIIPGGAKHVELDMGNDGIAVILNSLDPKADLNPDALEPRLVELRKTVGRAPGLSISIAVSGVDAGIQDLRDFYEEALEASMYRLYRGHGCIIHAREIRELPNSGYEYPIAAEKAMAAALLAGKSAEAKQEYDRIVASANHYPVNVFNLMISRVAFALDEAAKAVRKRMGEENESGKQVPMANLGGLETLAEINTRFYAIFDEIGSAILDRKTNRVERIIERIDRLIETGYMRQDLYIESIAQALDKSPTYISHVYKQCTGMTILDKIVAVRMSHAKDLLLATDLSVAEISGQSGFSSSSYFFKVFRKINGATPNEFRGAEEGGL